MLSYFGLDRSTSFLSYLQYESGPLPLFLYYLPAFFVFNTVALAIPPSPLRVPATLPVLVVLTTQFCLHNWSSSLQQTELVSVWICLHVLHYIDRVVLAHPDKEQWHKVDGPNARIKSEANGQHMVPQTFRSRLWWSLTSLANPGGVGWSWQINDIPPSPKTTKRRFVLDQIAYSTLLHVTMTAIMHYIANTPYGGFAGEDKETIPLSQAPFLDRVRVSLALMFSQYIGVGALGAFTHIAKVLLGLAQPEDCHPWVGSLKSAYTVRNVWSVTYHQMFRRPCTWTGTFIARDVLGLHKGRSITAFVRVFTAFFVSGVIHALAIYQVSGSGITRNMRFFTIQALAIWFEKQIIISAQRLGYRDGPWPRLVGYLWTLSWFGWIGATQHAASDTPGFLVFPWRPYDLLGVGYWMRRGKNA